MGTYGNREANWAVQNCDLLIVLGARLDVRQTGADTKDFARHAKIIQIDIDPAQLDNRVEADLNLNASTDNFLNQFRVLPNTFPQMDPQWVIEQKNGGNSTSTNMKTGGLALHGALER
jgi:acetolactate synthase-1/2/3 large subunit